ncbi:hypothetical protein AMTR_s00061p00139630 [Amborella trichopoda]|uniref:Inhibitor I9 domain-containing protein n=1 Tax=Amborella trichopoda TaxID=13333 RepID=U5D0J3_AMBTC|nr:hypothetical protein AMTR_s00061p00139630 [Amborella trichopoda]
MAGNKASLCLLGLCFSLFYSGFALKKPYVVYMGQHSHASLDQIDHARVTESHHELLATFMGSKEKAKDAIFYSYTLNVNGFAANLEEEEALEISKHPGVVSVFPDKLRELHTTHSWNFMRLERDGRIPMKSLWHQSNFGRDVIVANLDSGVWPESESFRDEGMGPVPSKWKGICINDDPQILPVKCNRKLIGARYFNKGYNAFVGMVNESAPLAPNSPRDFEGHGTHTLSTAAGSFVPNASIFGYASGTAKGGAPGARVAAYKVFFFFLSLSNLEQGDLINFVPIIFDLTTCTKYHLLLNGLDSDGDEMHHIAFSHPLRLYITIEPSRPHRLYITIEPAHYAVMMTHTFLLKHQVPGSNPGA